MTVDRSFCEGCPQWVMCGDYPTHCPLEAGRQQEAGEGACYACQPDWERDAEAKHIKEQS